VQGGGEQVVELVQVARRQGAPVEQAGVLRHLASALGFMVRRNMRV
jgi:hypothetical protein